MTDTATPVEWRQRSEQARDEARAWELKGHLERSRSFRAYAALCEGHAVIGELAEACRVDAMRALVGARERGLITEFRYDPHASLLRIRLRGALDFTTIALDEPTRPGGSMRTLLLAVVLASGCGGFGYSEAEMQAQRDKTTNVVNALDRLAADNSVCRQRMDTLTMEISALRSELQHGDAP